MSRAALLTTALLLAPALFVSAEVPPVETLWASISADHAMVADPLWGLEPGSQGELAALLADEQTGSASVGKAWTLHMAVHALQEGIVPSKQDMVTISSDAASRACNCFQDINGVDIAARERAQFWDLVRGMISVSSNDIAQAVAEHIGQKLDPDCALGAYPSECLQVYLNWANDHAYDIGVSQQTVFDKSWTLDQTTARDVLRWWTHAMEDPDPNFLEIAGWTGTYQFTTPPPFSKTYSFSRGAGNYPGWEAHKPGANTACNVDIPTGNACLVSSATRIGRRLVSVHMQSVISPDRTAILDYGFAKTFHPDPAGLSAPWAAVKDHSIACVSGTKAVSAVIKSSNDASRLVLWNVDMDAPSITTATEANPALVPTSLDLTAWAPPLDTYLTRPLGMPAPVGQGVNGVLAGAPEPNTPPITIGVPVPTLGTVIDVDVAPLGSTAFVLAQRGEDAIQLSTWGIDGQDLVPLGSTIFPASGLQGMKLLTLTQNRFLLVLHEDDDARVMQSWVASGDGSMELLDSVHAAERSEFDLAVQTHLGAPIVLSAGRNAVGWLRVDAWRMEPGGSLTLLDETGTQFFAERIAVSAAPVEALDGEFIVDAHFATVHRDGSNGRAELNYWAWDGLNLVARGSADVSPGALPANVEFELAPLGSSGLLLAKRADAISVDLDVFESRRDTPTVTPLFVVGNEVMPVDDFRGLCKVPRPAAGAPSEGDYLLATDEFFGDSLQVSGWRSAELPN